MCQYLEMMDTTLKTERQTRKKLGTPVDLERTQAELQMNLFRNQESEYSVQWTRVGEKSMFQRKQSTRLAK